MKPVDLRNANFASLRNDLESGRKAVYAAWITYGPGTTREVATKSGIDLLTLRPRTTDLCDLGLVELDSHARGHEGIYRAVSQDRWEAWHRDSLSSQMQLI